MTNEEQIESAIELISALTEVVGTIQSSIEKLSENQKDILSQLKFLKARVTRLEHPKGYR